MRKAQGWGLYFSFSMLLTILFISPVHAFWKTTPPNHAIASAHPLATEAGMEILAKGGNAFDAAVTVASVLAVVEPFSSGIGGGGFWLLHQPRGDNQIMVDGREFAPGKAHRDMYLDADGNVIKGASLNGPLAAAIPGSPAAWVHIANRYGKLTLAQTLAPAIRYAKEGFQVDKIYHERAEKRLEAIKASPAAASIFLADGQVPAVGSTITQKDLAQVLEKIVSIGHKGFYEGEVAEKLVEGVQASGGIWTIDDLKKYQVVERAPLQFEYKDMTITTVAPPSSGGVALAEIFNIISEDDLEALNSVQYVHLLVESMRRAYRDRAEFLGDPDFVNVPVKKLMNIEYGKDLRKTIDASKATDSDSMGKPLLANSGPHTTHYSIIDEDGNRVAATLSINYSFGSGFVPAGTGVLLNNEMDDFSAKPGEPNVYGLVGAEANAIAPYKRPLSSMTPTFVETKDKVGILGTPGGSRIITMVLLGILEFAEGEPPEMWVAAPRFHHQYLPDYIQHEPNVFGVQQTKKLKAMGHRFSDLGYEYGNMHAILWDKKKKLVQAASDPRGIGKAVVSQ